MVSGTIAYTIPGPVRAEELARLHVTCWQQAYRGFVPDRLLDGVDMADRTDRWRGYLAAEGHPTFLAEVDGEAAGFIRAGRLQTPLAEGYHGHIFALYILARHQRRGIGRRLMGLAAADWLGQGGQGLSVGVLTANRRAVAFYEALGGRFIRSDVYDWDGHSLPESIYVFDDVSQLARFGRMIADDGEA